MNSSKSERFLNTSVLRMRVINGKAEICCPNSDNPCGRKHVLKLSDDGIMTVQNIRELV